MSPKPCRAAERAIGGPGHEERRVGLLLADREDLVLALDARLEVRPLVPYAALVQERQDQVDGLLLDVAAMLEVPPEALELVGPVARAQPQHHAAAREDVPEGHVLDDADRIVEGE